MKKVKKKVKLKFIPVIIMLVILVIFFFLFKYIISIKPSLIIIRGNNLLSDRQIIDEGELRNFKYFLPSNSNINKLKKNKTN